MFWAVLNEPSPRPLKPRGIGMEVTSLNQDSGLRQTITRKAMD